MKAKVIMLETTEKSNIIKGWSNQLFISPPMKVKDTDTFQHIYLTEPNVEIRIGDLFINNGKILIAKDEYEKQRHSLYKGIGGKIICSTDKSLHNLSDVNRLEDFEVPQSSEQSIQLLIDYYNKNGKMPDEVVVEECTNHISFFGHDLSTKELKLNSQGTVDITIPGEKMYSRKEVIRLCNKAWLKFPNSPNMLEEFENWISKNL